MAVRPEVGLVLKGTVDQVREAAGRTRIWSINGIEIIGLSRPVDPSCVFIGELRTLRFARLFAAPLTNIEILQQLPQLNHVVISHVARGQSIPLDFALQPALAHADVEWFDGASTIFQAKKLRSLALTNYPSTGSRRFDSFERLISLRLSGSPLAEIEAFKRLPMLRWVALLKLNELSNFRGLSGHPALRFLWIEGCKELATLEWLAGMEHLETLRILDCGTLTGIEVLRSLYRLRHIHIHGKVNVMADDFAFFRNLPNIESVIVKGMPKTEADFWKNRNKRYDLLRSDLRGVGDNYSESALN